MRCARDIAPRIYTYNLKVFDPTWFVRAGVDIAARLRRQLEAKPTSSARADRGLPRIPEAGRATALGGLVPALVRGFLRRRLPILTGLSSTYLYRVPREYGPDDTPDDIRGVPSGHFVVIAGHDAQRRRYWWSIPISRIRTASRTSTGSASTAPLRPSCSASSRTMRTC